MNQKNKGEKERICQSCAMPMGQAVEFYGTNKDGSKNPNYCKFCYKNGSFTEECNMDEMIEMAAEYTARYNENMSLQTARQLMQGLFPSLKRWKK